MIAPSKTSSLRLACAAIFIVGWLAATAPAASAVNYTVEACEFPYPDTVTTGKWDPSPPFYLWHVYNDCPTELRLEMDRALNSTQPGILSMQVSGIFIASFQFTMHGGDTTHGGAYEFLLPWPNNITQSLPARMPGDPPQSVDLTMPNNVTKMSLRVRCVTTPCPASETLYIRDLKYTMNDVTPPSIGGPWTSSSTDYGDIKRNTWNRPDDLTVRFKAFDNGSGIRNAVYTTTGFNRPMTNACQAGPVYNSPFICPSKFSDYSATLFNSQMGDGWHTLTGTAVDGVGWERTQSIQFAVDRVAPPRPFNLYATDRTASGWTHDLGNDLLWTSPREATETATESGVVGSIIDVDPADPASGQPDPAPLNGGPLGHAGLTLPGDGRWDVWVKQVDRAGNIGEARGLILNRDIDQPKPPTLHATPWLNRASLIDGAKLTWDEPGNLANLESGICGYSLSWNELSHPDSQPEIDGPATETPIPANLQEGENPVRLRAVSCAGLASETAQSLIRVDDTSPELDASVSSDDRWVTSAVEMELQAQDDASGVKNVQYTINGKALVDTAGDSATFKLMDGAHELAASAFDFAGNKSAELRRKVNVDTEPPSAWFTPRDSSTRTRVSAIVEDATSGISDAHLELRRVDAEAPPEELTWRRFGDTVTGAKSHRLVAELPDESLPDGEYLVRVVARDHAGNVGVGDDTRSVTSYRLPLRAVATISTALATYKRVPCKLAKKKTRNCRERLVPDLRNALRDQLVEFGDRTLLTGEARLSDGTPLPDQTLEIYVQPKWGQREFLGATQTSEGGRFTYPVESGVTRTFTVRFAGNAVTKPAQDQALLGVRGAAVLRVNRKRSRVGEQLVFTGRLSSGGAGLPSTGKIRIVEYLAGGLWQPVLGFGKTDLKGRFRITYRPTRRIRKPIRLDFRLALPTEDNWPYEAGVSNRVSVRLLP